MRFYKLRVVPNAPKVASSFNEQMVGEESPSPDAAFEAEGAGNVLVGEKVSKACWFPFLLSNHRLGIRTSERGSYPGLRHSMANLRGKIQHARLQVAPECD